MAFFVLWRCRTVVVGSVPIISVCWGLMVEAGHRKRRCFDTNGACDTACMAADHESVISVIGHHKPAPAPRDPAVRRCRARCWLRARRARRRPDDAWSHHRGASRRCFRRSTLYTEPQPGPRHFTHTTPAARHSTLHTQHHSDVLHVTNPETHFHASIRVLSPLRTHITTEPWRAACGI